MKDYPPVGIVKGKKDAVRDMFDSIAPRYDLLNHLLSFGIDRRWRKQAVSLLAPEKPARILDIATGTGDLAIEALALNPEKIIGVDISDEMLRIGTEKIEMMGYTGKVVLRKGDAERLPFSDSQFDGVLVAFGVRNFENLTLGLQQIRRVLRAGGTVVILEFSHPRRFPIKQCYNFYGRHILPHIGRRISKSDGAYQYLPDSIAAFPDGPRFLDLMRDAGFDNLHWKPLTFGIVSLYKGTAT